ncbi:MAG TPA: potassium-transporting ATPase subunit KdpA [Daejeonella sp.]|nr:potassium-transporting ATPase subunit KdpA [Daejeonella sp.]
MKTEIPGIVFIYLLTVLLAMLLGKYIARVFNGEKTWLDFMAPLERLIFRLSGIDVRQEMSWKQHLVAMLTINLIWFVFAFFCLRFQGYLPLNPDHNPNQSPDLAFNTAISFLVNCNLQDYSGETGATYFTQTFIFMFLHFVSAATGIAAMMVVFKAMKEQITTKLGNFWQNLVLSITRILLPLSLLVAVFLVFNGTPSSYIGKATYINLQGDTAHVSRGPAAAMIAIKQIGTNGGGWFGANSAHPLENPNYYTNIVECMSITLIPMALVFALGYYLKRRKLSWVIFGVMTLGFLLVLIPSINSEIRGNPYLATLGISQPGGSMEGKEVRLGPAASAYWSICTTVTSNGSSNAMHDSMMPITGAMQLFGMMVNSLYGGVGVGYLNFYIFMIIAVFISGLMVGRTPEFLGRKIEAREMKIATLVALLHPFLILQGTAMASYIWLNFAHVHWAVQPAKWLNNPGYHGFTEILYQFTSSSANNGSSYAGLSANTVFWNLSTGLVMILGRFLPIIGPVAIAGLMANKKFIPESAGTLKTDTATFGIMILAVIVIIAALSFFPALALGPVSEYLSIPKN